MISLMFFIKVKNTIYIISILVANCDVGFFGNDAEELLKVGASSEIAFVGLSISPSESDEI